MAVTPAVQPWSRPRPSHRPFGWVRTLTLTRIGEDGVPTWELVLGAFILLFSAGTGIQRLRSVMGERASVRSSVEGDPLEQAIWLLLYGASLVLLLRQPRECLLRLARARLVWLLPLLALASLTWTETPDVTLKRVVAFLGSTVVGAYFGTRYSWRQLFDLTLWALGASAILSVAAALLMPSYGISGGSHEGAWSGIYLQKNWLGRMMALSAVLWLVRALLDARRRPLAVAMAATSTALVLLSASATGLVLLVALTALLPLYRVVRVRSWWVMPSVVVLGLLGGGLAVWLVAEMETLLDVLGRDVTLTGRSQLWDLAWRMIEESPWLGYGYGGFWLGWDGPSAYIWDRTHWMPPHAHSGFLDLLLDLGWIGLGALVLSLLAGLLQAVRLIRDEHSLIAAFPLVYLVFLVLSNVTESRLVTHNASSWILYVAIVLAVGAPAISPSARR